MKGQILCNYSTPPPHEHASMDTYTIMNTSSHNTATRRPPHPSHTQQHTTTHNNSTRVHKITYVPLFKKLWDIIYSTQVHKITYVPLFKKLWDIIFFLGQSLYEPFLGTLWGGLDFFGPLKMSLEMAHKVIVPQKKIMSRSFLNSSTLIVIFLNLALHLI